MATVSPVIARRWDLKAFWPSRFKVVIDVVLDAIVINLDVAIVFKSMLSKVTVSDSTLSSYDTGSGASPVVMSFTVSIESPSILRVEPSNTFGVN